MGLGSWHHTQKMPTWEKIIIECCCLLQLCKEYLNYCLLNFMGRSTYSNWSTSLREESFFPFSFSLSSCFIFLLVLFFDEVLSEKLPVILRARQTHATCFRPSRSSSSYFCLSRSNFILVPATASGDVLKLLCLKK